MKGLIKKITAAFCVVGIMTLSACGEATSTAMTIDGEEILAGEYILAQLTANSNAVSKYHELNPDADASAKGFDYYKEEIEGKPFKDWVIDNAVEILAKKRVYEKKFEELGLSLTDDEVAEIKAEVEKTWNEEDSSLADYGITEKTMGEFYEKIGIGKESYYRISIGDEKAEKVFHAIYDTGGTKEVPVSEMLPKLEELFFRYRIVPVSLTDSNGDKIEDEEQLKTLEDMANDYVERIKAGGSFLEIINEYKAYVEEQEKEENPDAKTEENEETEENNDDETEENDDDEEEPTDNDYDRMMSFSDVSYYDYYYSTELYGKISELEINAPEIYEDENCYYVIVRLDIKEREDWLEDVKETVLHELKGDELDKEVIDLISSVTVVRNEAAIKRYDPKKALVI